MAENSYNNWYAMSDKAIIKQIGEFVKHNRLQKNKSQAQVAEAAGISRSTLSLIERGETVTLLSLIQVLRVLELLHVLEAFKVETLVSPILLAKLEQKKPQRVRTKKQPDKNGSEW